MHYGKIVDGALWFAPKKVTLGASTIYNPPVDMLLRDGYKPIVPSEAPDDAPTDYHYELSYEDTGESIIYVWTLKEDDVTPEDLFEILMGEKL